jgi:hypothetical protein
VPAVAQSKEGRAANGDGMRRCVVTLPTQLTEHPASDWFSASFAGTERANPLMIKHAIVGCISRVQRPLLKLKLLRSPRPRTYRFVVKWELILCPGAKRRFILPL